MATTDHRELGLKAPLSLTQEQIDRLQAASLEILSRTGIRFCDGEALELFRRAGAAITEGNIVHLDAKRVEWALACAPKTITICDREGNPSMELGPNRCYYGVGSDCAYLYDLTSGQRRKALLSDLRDGYRLVDGLPHVDFVMSMMLPADVPLGSHEPYQMAAMLEETIKPVLFVGEAAESTTCAIEMAEAVVGGPAALEKAPFVINYANTKSALYHNVESVQRLLQAAAKNVPSVYSPSSARGLVAPMTGAGAAALGNAAQLAGLVLSQLKREGSPYIRTPPGGSLMDMRTMVGLYVTPDGGTLGWDLARQHGLPLFGMGGASDAKVFDAQAVAEATLSLFVNTINGAGLIHDMGYLDCAMTYSYELLTLCDEIVSWLKWFRRPAVIDDDTLALDLIHEVGHRDGFLESDHTYRHTGKEWRPTLFDRFDYARWVEKGAVALDTRLREKAADIIARHRAPRLPEQTRARLNEIRERYTR